MTYAKPQSAGFVSLWENHKQTNENSPVITGFITIPVDALSEMLPVTQPDGTTAFEFKVAIWPNNKVKSEQSPHFTGRLQDKASAPTERKQQPEVTKPQAKRFGVGKTLN